MLAATALFDPALLALLWFRPAGTIDLEKQPVWLAAWILVLPVICTLLFVSYLFTQHRIEIMRDSGSIHFFRRNGGKPSLTLPKGSISRFAIIEQWYRPSRSKPLRNYVLTAICNDGKEVPLCLSTDATLIQGLAGDIEQAKGHSSPNLPAA